MSTTKRTVTREIIREPSTGRKAVKVIGILIFVTSIIGIILCPTVLGYGVTNNSIMPEEITGLEYLFMGSIFWLIISIIMIYVGRTRRETVVEEITTETEQTKLFN